MATVLLLSRHPPTTDLWGKGVCSLDAARSEQRIPRMAHHVVVPWTLLKMFQERATPTAWPWNPVDIYKTAPSSSTTSGIPLMDVDVAIDYDCTFRAPIKEQWKHGDPDDSTNQILAIVNDSGRDHPHWMSKSVELRWNLWSWRVFCCPNMYSCLCFHGSTILKLGRSFLQSLALQLRWSWPRRETMLNL